MGMEPFSIRINREIECQEWRIEQEEAHERILAEQVLARKRDYKQSKRALADSKLRSFNEKRVS